jgi:hypothetical protein
VTLRTVLCRAPETRVDHTLSTDVIDALSHGAIARPVWHLAPRDRWNLLRDTLLGHVPLRGGMRTRDLPLDPTARHVLRTSTAIQSREYAIGDGVQARFGDWLYLFAVLVEPAMAVPGDHADQLAHHAVAECVRELRRALGGSDSSDFANTCGTHHRLLGVLGLSRQEWQRAAPAKGRLRHEHDVARLGARICAAWRHHAGPPESELDIPTWLRDSLGPLGRQRALLDALTSQRRVVATLKSIDVQSYIHRAKSHWMMRGASVWCSQSLAFARDCIANTHGGLLLSDSDALVSFVFPEGVPAPADILAEVERAWRSRQVFAESFPRLAPYHRALSDGSIAPADPLACLPRLSLRCSAPTSLLELCIARVRDGHQPDAVVGGLPSEAGVQREAGPVCEFVSGDAACVSEAPPWLSASGHRAGQALGWTALCWSLSGTTMRTHWYHGICAELKCHDYSMANTDYGGWLEQMTLRYESLTFLKLDGDGIGARFEGTSMPSRPVLSLQLGRVVLARIAQATRRVIEAHDAAGLPKYLPVDLVYAGGDDIFFCMPDRHIDAFLSGFGECTGLHDVAPWDESRFSYVSVALPGGGEFTDNDQLKGSSDFKRANLAAARALSPGLRELVKRDRQDEAGIAEVNQSIADLGFRCEFRHRSRTSGMVHGVGLRLVAAGQWHG